MTGWRLWVDDIRPEPDDGQKWHIARNSGAAVTFLNVARQSEYVFEEVSLDFDLGGDDTTREVVLWMVEHEYWPKKFFVHSANPVGKKYVLAEASQYGPTTMLIGWTGGPKW